MDFIRRKRPSKKGERNAEKHSLSEFEIRLVKNLKTVKKTVWKVQEIKTEKLEEGEEEVDETQVRVRKPTASELEKKQHQEERKKQYMQWGKGLVQKKQLEEKLSSDLQEAEKPLARYIDDKDLDKQLRQQERVGKQHYA